MKHKPGRSGHGPSTIHHVAERAGVSPMTVSRVINGKKNVKASTRARVEAAIRDLSYSPNPAATSLARDDLIRIGLLYGNPSAAYLSEFLVGGLEECSRRNVQLVVEQCEPGDENAVAEHLIESGIDGIILPPPLCDAASVIKVLAAAHTPAVAVATGSAADSLSAVSIDDYRAAAAMTRHLINLGHQRIGFIIGHPNQTASGRRLAGYRAALAEARIPEASELIAQGFFTYRSGLDAAETLLRLEEPPSAIFASNDDMAAAAVAVAHRHNLDVPADLTVCGFDDTALATTIWPELTTIRQPVAEMSRAAVRLVIDEIRRQRAGDPEQHPHTLLDFALIRRQSDAAPRRRPPILRTEAAAGR